VIRLTSSWTSPHLLPRLHKRLNRARRRNFIAFEPALEIGASIGIHHGGDAHRREPPSQLRKLDLGELVLHAESPQFALSSPTSVKPLPEVAYVGFSPVFRNFTHSKIERLTLNLELGHVLGE